MKNIDMSGIYARQAPPKGGRAGWLLQRVTAVIAFAIILTHFIVIEFSTPGQPVTFAESAQRLSNPLFLSLWWTLLAAGVFHAGYGLRNLITDFFKVNERKVTLTMLGISIGVFALGIFFMMPLILGRPLFGG